MKYANDRTPEAGDQIVGRDIHANLVTGQVVATVANTGHLRLGASPFPVDPADALVIEDALNLALMVPHLQQEIQDLAGQVAILSAGRTAPAPMPAGEPDKSPAAAPVTISDQTIGGLGLGTVAGSAGDLAPGAVVPPGCDYKMKAPEAAAPFPAAADHSHTELDVAAEALPIGGAEQGKPAPSQEPITTLSPTAAETAAPPAPTEDKPAAAEQGTSPTVNPS